MAILSTEMLTLDRGELLGFRADELVVGSNARAAFGEPFGDPALATSATLQMKCSILAPIAPELSQGWALCTLQVADIRDISHASLPSWSSPAIPTSCTCQNIMSDG